MPPRKSALTFAQVASIAGMLPEVVVATSYGTDALKVKGKLFARIWEDGSTLVLRLPIVVRDHLIASQPEQFFLTDHYRDYPYVLVRLAAVTSSDLAPLLEEAWRQVAPKRLIAAFDERATSGKRTVKRTVKQTVTRGAR
jgi:hypothetical protein